MSGTNEPGYEVLAERIAQVETRLLGMMISETQSRKDDFAQWDSRLTERRDAINKALELEQGNHANAVRTWVAVVLAIMAAALSLLKSG